MRKRKVSAVRRGTGPPGIKERVVLAIKAYKGTLKEFSKASGIPYPSLMDYVSGKKKPGLDALAAIVSTSGVSALWILTGEGHQSTEPAIEWHVDSVLLSRIAKETELAFLRVVDLNQEPNDALSVVLMMNDEEYYELTAQEMAGHDFSQRQPDLDRLLLRTHEETLVTAIVYNQVYEITDKKARDKRIRQEIYGVLGLLRSRWGRFGERAR